MFCRHFAVIWRAGHADEKAVGHFIPSVEGIVRWNRSAPPTIIASAFGLGVIVRMSNNTVEASPKAEPTVRQHPRGCRRRRDLRGPKPE